MVSTVVRETRDAQFLSRAQFGVVGFVHCGPLSGRYVLLHVTGVVPDWWSIEISFPVDSDPEVQQSSDFAAPWEEFRDELESWNVEWCPPSHNRRAALLVFGYDPNDVGANSPRKRYRLALGIDPIKPGNVEGRESTVAFSALHAEAMLRGVLLGEDHEVGGTPESPGRRRLNKQTKQRIELVDGLVSRLWEHGYGIAIVPLDSAVRIEPVIDPWKPFD